MLQLQEIGFLSWGWDWQSGKVHALTLVKPITNAHKFFIVLMVSLRPMRRSNFCDSVSVSLSILSISFHLSHGFASISHWYMWTMQCALWHCRTTFNDINFNKNSIEISTRMNVFHCIASIQMEHDVCAHTIIKLTFMFSSYLIIKTFWNNFTLHFWPVLLTLSNKLLKKWWWRRPDLMHHLQSGKSSKRSKRWFFNGKNRISTKKNLKNKEKKHKNWMINRKKTVTERK